MCKSKPVRVLLVDDEASLRLPLKTYLEGKHNYSVTVAASHQEALAQAKSVQGAYEVALIDQVLMYDADGVQTQAYGSDGIQLMEEIKAHYPDIECIIFTGWDIDASTQALQAGAFRYMKKPFDVMELAGLIRQAAQQVWLREVSRAILTERKLDHLYARIAEAACFLGPADEAAIKLRDPITNKMKTAGTTYEGPAQFQRHFKERRLTQEILESGQAVRVLDADADERVDPAVWQAGFQSFLGVSISGESGNQGVLYVYSRQKNTFRHWETVAIIQTLAGQAGLAISNARALNEIDERARNMEELNKTGQGFTKAKKIEDLLSLAWDFASGQLKESTFFIALYDKQNDVLSFPIAKDKNRAISIPPRDLKGDRSGWGIAGYLVKKGCPEWRSANHAETLERCRSLDIRMRVDGEGASPPETYYFILLKSGEEIIGVLSLQSDTPNAFSDSFLSVCRALGNQLGVAIQNLRLHQDTEQGLRRLRATFDASKEVTRQGTPNEMLRKVVSMIPPAVDAWWAQVVLIGLDQHPYLRINSQGAEAVPNTDELGNHAQSLAVMWLDKLLYFEDLLDDGLSSPPQAMLDAGIRAAICLPFERHGKPGGVLWVYYKDPHQFTPAEKEALQLYAAQAANAYEAAVRVVRLQRLREADDALASGGAVSEVRQQIVESACKTLNADSALFWPYDDARKCFLPAELVAHGISVEELNRRREKEPGPAGTAQIVMDRTYIAVEDVEDPKYQTELGSGGHKLREEIGVKAFQGVALQLGEEALGVLYVNYCQTRRLSQGKRDVLKMFAITAALALKRARLLQRVERVEAIARAAAEWTVQGDLDNTLKAIVEGIHEVLSAGPITLYAYDEGTETLSYRPAMVDVKCPAEVIRLPRVEPDSIVYKMLHRAGGPHVAEDAQIDPYFGNRPFTKREGVRSSISLALHASGHIVGVLFVNFRERRRFTQDDLDVLHLFANQAALAIYNVQAYQHGLARLRALQALHDAGQTVAGSLDLKEILQSIAEQAGTLAAPDQGQTFFTHVALVAGNTLTAVAAWPLSFLDSVQRTMHSIDLKREDRIGIAGRAAVEKTTRYAFDVTNDKDYLITHASVRSQLSVPILYDGRVIGVISAESALLHAFGQEHFSRALETLAAQAAIAIQNARKYRHMQALHEASKAITAGITDEPGTVLYRILEQAVSCIAPLDGPKPTLGVIQTYIAANRALYVECIYPESARSALIARIGERRSITRGNDTEKRIGITGRAVETRQPQLVPNAPQDPDYVPFLDSTLSELDIPLLAGDDTLGVLSLESDTLGGFDAQDQRTLSALAEMAVIAIQNARRYGELKRAKAMVGGRTALAWMGMSANAWRHSIDGHAVTIQDLVLLVRRQVDRLREGHGNLFSWLKGAFSRLQLGRASRDTGNTWPALYARLDKINELAGKILEKPITPPLSREEGVSDVPLNTWAKARAEQRWQFFTDQEAVLCWDLQAPDNATTWVSPEWLQRAFDILVDNAVKAVTGRPLRQITIGTRAVLGRAAIVVSDTGPGMPESVRARVGLEYIEKPSDVKGLGMGLLMAQVIAQTYGGEISVESTGAEGTTMAIWLPWNDPDNCMRIQSPS